MDLDGTVFCYKKCIINYNDIVYYAKYSINENSNELVYQLCLLEEHEELNYILKKLSELESEEVEYIKNKWLYAILLYFYRNRNNYTDPLSIVENVYVDFDYPEAISHLIRYMPIDNDSEYGDRAIYNKWSDYIINNSEEYIK